MFWAFSSKQIVIEADEILKIVFLVLNLNIISFF